MNDRNKNNPLYLAFIAIGALVLYTYLSAIHDFDLRSKASDPVTVSSLSNWTTYTQTDKKVLLSPMGGDTSQYSPWFMTRAGWETYLIYYCKNTPIGGVYRDRVWRAEFDHNFNLLNNDMMIDGTIGTPHDLVCSPGVVIDTSGTWHMYFVTADREKPMTLYLYHATAPAPGTSWTLVGKVNGISQPYDGGYMETPSPYLIDGKIVVYFVGNAGRLYRMNSSDGQNFTAPELLNAPANANSGRVVPVSGGYVYTYSLSRIRPFDPPDRIRMALSADGRNFSETATLLDAVSGSWDATFIFSPMFLSLNGKAYLLYAGNNGTYPWWGANTTIGYREFTPPTIHPEPDPPTPPPSDPPDDPEQPPAPDDPDLRGDLNKDGKISVTDYSLFINDYLEFVTTENFNVRSDFNGDHKISISDYSAFIKAYVDWMNI